MDETDKLGLQGFSKKEEKKSDLQTTQYISEILIVEHLREMDVDTILFEKMSNVENGDLAYISKSEAEKINLINNGFSKTKWHFQTLDDGTNYFKAYRESMYNGWGSLTFNCDYNHLPFSVATYAKSPIFLSGEVSLTIDGEEYPVNADMLPNDRQLLMFIFKHTISQIEKIKNAEEVGFMFHDTNPDLFIGINFIINKDNREFNSYMKRCLKMLQTQSPEKNDAVTTDKNKPITTGKNLLISSSDKAKSRKFNKKAIKLLNAGNTSKALTLLDEAAFLNPYDSEIMGNYGYALYLSGDFSSAVEILVSALELKPNRGSSWGNLGQSYSALGQFNKAANAFINYYKHSSKKQAAKKQLKYWSKQHGMLGKAAKQAIRKIGFK